MENEKQTLSLLNQKIFFLFLNALRISLFRLSNAFFIVRTLLWQKKAQRVRLKQQSEGLVIPPFMIFSITHACNLRCTACYARELHPHPKEEMSDEKLVSVIGEANALGVSIMLLAGGEPLTRKSLFTITKRFPNIVFALFTNGLLIDDEALSLFKRQKNLIPIISIEGFQKQTDARRGEGVFRHNQSLFPKLKANKTFYGVSLTVHQGNIEELLSEDFITDMVKNACGVFFFVEYVPVDEKTQGLVLDEAMRQRLLDKMKYYRKAYPALFIAFPGEEEMFGGCLSSGRGFIHVNPEGDLEPCPFAPYSDVNLKDVPLKEALQSRLLQTIRQNHDKLSETKGGCALWENRAWLQSVIEN